MMKSFSLYLFFLLVLVLSGCGGEDSASSGLSAECSYYKKAINKETFSGTKTQSILDLEQKQKDCSKAKTGGGAFDFAGALNEGSKSPDTTQCVERNLQEFKKAHSCK